MIRYFFVFERWPWVQTVLLVAATIYLLYLAWNLARSGSFHTGSTARPLSFFQSVAIQWLNPKAWLVIKSGNWPIDCRRQ